MSYSLGVDLGTTFVAAAIAHASRVEMFTLGDRAVVTPSVVYLREDGIAGHGRCGRGRRAVSSPDRVGREFKRRLGDPTPVMLGGAPHAVTDAARRACSRDVVDRVTETEGTRAGARRAHPPGQLGPVPPRRCSRRSPSSPALRAALHGHRARGGRRALRRHPRTSTTATPSPSTTSAAAPSTPPCCASAATAIEILGTPEGIERLGGVDFDEAILATSTTASGHALSELDMSDPQTATALARLRQDCVLAKEALSIDTETIIPVSPARTGTSTSESPAPTSRTSSAPRSSPPSARCPAPCARPASPPKSSPRSCSSAAPPGSRWSPA